MFRPSFYIVAVIAILAVVGWQYTMTTPTDTGNEETPNQRAEILAPGWGELDFIPPEVGTYELPRIKKAGGGEILLSNG